MFCGCCSDNRPEADKLAEKGFGGMKGGKGPNDMGGRGQDPAQVRPRGPVPRAVAAARAHVPAGAVYRAAELMSLLREPSHMTD